MNEHADPNGRPNGSETPNGDSNGSDTQRAARDERVLKAVEVIRPARETFRRRAQARAATSRHH